MDARLKVCGWYKVREGGRMYCSLFQCHGKWQLEVVSRSTARFCRNVSSARERGFAPGMHTSGKMSSRVEGPYVTNETLGVSYHQTRIFKTRRRRDREEGIGRHRRILNCSVTILVSHFHTAPATNHDPSAQRLTGQAASITTSAQRVRFFRITIAYKP